MLEKTGRNQGSLKVDARFAQPSRRSDPWPLTLNRLAGNQAVTRLIGELGGSKSAGACSCGRAVPITEGEVTVSRQQSAAEHFCQSGRGRATLDVSVTPPSLLRQGTSYFFQSNVDVTAGMAPAHLCRCLEYRQYVRGVAKINGGSVSNRFPLPGGHLGPQWQEDGRSLEDVLPGFSPNYGHRDSPLNSRNDAYVPSRDEGCRYNNYDTPGFRLPLRTWHPGDYLELYLSFRGDVLQANRVLARRYWEVKGSARLPSDLPHGAPTPQPAVQRQAWEERFLVAAQQGDAGRMRLMNEALEPDVARYPRLRFPVRRFNPQSVSRGGVYYDPGLRELGSTEWGQRVAGSNRLTRDGGQFDAARDPNTVFTFIVLGPAAVSPGTRAFTRETLYHESEHLRLAERIISRGWSAILARANQPVSATADEEARTHARAFRFFFRHLEWRGSLSGRGTLGGTDPAEAANDLHTIQVKYWRDASSAGRDRVVQELMAVIDDNVDLVPHLRDVIGALRPIEGKPSDRGLRARLLRELAARTH